MLLDLKISFKELTSFHRLEACATNLCYYNFVFAIAWPGDKCKQEYEGCLGMLIYSSALPYFREIRELVEMGLAPGGAASEQGISHAHDRGGHRLPRLDGGHPFRSAGGLLFSCPHGRLRIC